MTVHNFQGSCEHNAHIKTINSIMANHLSTLTGSELKVLLFCIQRTLYFEKVAEIILLRHFLYGIPKVIDPVGLSRITIIRSLTALCHREFLHKTPATDERQNRIEVLYRNIQGSSSLQFSPEAEAK